MPMDQPAAGFPVLRFATRDWPESTRIDAWRDLLRRKLLHVSVDVISDRPFEVVANARLMPDFRFGWGRFGPSVNRRTRDIVARDNDDFFLLINREGSLALEQRDREVMLRSGDAHLISCAEPASYVRGDAGEVLCARISRGALSQAIPSLDDAVGRVIPRESEALRLLVGYLTSLGALPEIHSSDLSARVALHVGDLAALAIGADADSAALASRRGVRAARLDSVKRYVNTNLGDPELSVGAVATHHRLTERYVQRLFEAEGTTFTQFVLGTRLTRVFEALHNPEVHARPIGDLATAFGFGDISYFNRVFRRRFGTTPGELRTLRASKSRDSH